MVRYDKDETNIVHFSESTAFNLTTELSAGRNITHTMPVRNVDILSQTVIPVQ